MKREDLDWSVLRGALLAFVASALVAGAVTGAAHVLRGKKQLEFTRNNAMFQGVNAKYLAVDEEEKLIRKYYPRFLDLYQAGIIGKEERLNWIETLRDAGERLRIPTLSYEIRSQEVYTPEFPLDLGRYQLYSSPMGLNVQALHEGDLLRLQQLLDTRASGHYSTQSCRMSRSQGLDLTRADRGNIIIQCEMNWFTIKLADGTEIKVES